MILFAVSDAWDVAGFVLTVVGFALTLTSLWYAIVQVRKTASAAEAARAAAEETLMESRRGFQKYTLANALRCFNEVKRNVELKEWARAAIRVADLADLAAQLANLDSAWRPFAEELRNWGETFTRVSIRALKRYSSSKWKITVRQLQAVIDTTHGPFATT